MRDSSALIPAEGIELTEAYAELVTKIEEAAILLPDFDEEDVELIEKSRIFEDSVGHDPDEYADVAEYWHLMKVAHLFLRGSLERGDLKALVRDPRNGQDLQVGREGWIPERWREAGYVPPGIWTNFISREGYDDLGPVGTYIGSASQPVFFRRSEFDAWLAKYAVTPLEKKHRGRPLRAGGYNRLDRPLHITMADIIGSGRAQSVTDAAREVVDDAKGSREEASRIKRLVDGYRKFAEQQGWPLEPPFPSI